MVNSTSFNNDFTDFINSVKQAYPNYPALIEKLENNSTWAGEYFNNSYGMITEDEVLSSTSLEELKIKARLIKTQKALHQEWIETYKG